MADAFHSDGCSLPKFLRIFIPRETPMQIAVCVAHDKAYTIGGDRRTRAIADCNLLIGMLITGMNVDLAHQYYTAVRCCGKPFWGSGNYTDDVIDAGKPEVRT